MSAGFSYECRCAKLVISSLPWIIASLIVIIIYAKDSTFTLTHKLIANVDVRRDPYENTKLLIIVGVRDYRVATEHEVPTWLTIDVVVGCLTFSTYQSMVQQRCSKCISLN